MYMDRLCPFLISFFPIELYKYFILLSPYRYLIYKCFLPLCRLLLHLLLLLSRVFKFYVVPHNKFSVNRRYYCILTCLIISFLCFLLSLTGSKAGIRKEQWRHMTSPNCTWSSYHIWTDLETCFANQKRQKQIIGWLTEQLTDNLSDVVAVFLFLLLLPVLLVSYPRNHFQDQSQEALSSPVFLKVL